MAQLPGQQAKYQYPSRFGSHRSMVLKDNEDGTVVCQDEFGEYTTTRDRLDNGCADPVRYALHRIQKLFAGKERTEQ